MIKGKTLKARKSAALNVDRFMDGRSSNALQAQSRIHDSSSNKRPRHDKQEPETEQGPRDIRDVVTPLHSVPYEDQLTQKHESLLTILKSITRDMQNRKRYDQSKVASWVKLLRGPCCPRAYGFSACYL